MNYKDKYLKINAVYGESIREQRVNNTIRKLKSTFKDSPSYSKVNMSTPNLDIDQSYEIDAQIVDNSDIRDEKKIITFIDDDLKSGNYIVFLNKFWLVTHFDELGDVYKRGIMNRCYTTLKWQDENNIIREAWFSRKTDVSPNFGVDDRKVILTMPDERRQIVVQSNQHTQKFKKSQRFILDGRAWKIITLDDIADGIINIVLQEDQINSAKDNEELRVADYKENEYSLEIENDSNLSIKVNQSLQLDIKATKNGKSVDLNEITISSSNPEVGIIDNVGLFTPMKVGSTTIKLEYMGIEKTINILVRDILVHNYTVEIIGSSNIRLGKTERYEAVFKNNGSVVDKACEFTLLDTDLVTIEEINSNYIYLKANSKSKMGNIVLKVRSQNNLIHGEKNIQIKGYI